MRVVALVATLAFVALAGWRIVGQLQAERLANVDPERALQAHPGDPDALWALAERQLAQGERAAAAATARTLLAREPLQGRAFRLLAQIEEDAGHDQQARRLYAIAAQRAPRDSEAISGLVRLALRSEDYPEALRWIDFYLRTSPDRAAASGRLLPQLAPLARDGRFASALVATLRQNPPWREQMLRVLWTSRAAADRVYGQLDEEHALSPEEFAGWIDALIGQGDWDEANTRWAARTPGAESDDRLLVYNGDFRREPSGAGFDWRLRVAGVASVDFAAAGAGTGGRVMHLRFFDQSVRGAVLEHPLRLPPGAYAVRLRLRARGLHSAGGLQWQLVCPSRIGAIAIGEPLFGSFDWIEPSLSVQVPQTDCPGQWLRLNTPSRGGKGLRVAGELWIDAVRIEPATVAPPTRPAPNPVQSPVQNP